MTEKPSFNSEQLFTMAARMREQNPLPHETMLPHQIAEQAGVHAVAYAFESLARGLVLEEEIQEVKDSAKYDRDWVRQRFRPGLPCSRDDYMKSFENMNIEMDKIDKKEREELAELGVTKL